jgi:hypothetical protein
VSDAFPSRAKLAERLITAAAVDFKGLPTTAALSLWDAKVKIGAAWWDVLDAARSGDKPAVERALAEVGL